MKFTCLQENLLKGLTIARQSSSRATTLPVLNTFLLQGKQGSLTISSTNLEIGIKVTIRGKEEAEGSICIPQDLLLSYIRNLPQDKLDLTVVDKQLTICQGNDITADFQGIISEEFPQLPQIEAESSLTIATTDLKSCLKTVYSALPKNDSRPEIAGVYMSKKGQHIVFVGTDGFRLTERKHIVPVLDEEDFHCTIPSKTVAEMIRVLDLIEDEEVTLEIGSSQLHLISHTVEIVSKLIEGNFPQYEGLIPQHFARTVQGDSQEITQAIKLAAVFSHNSVNDVKLHIQDEHTLKISSSQSQIGTNATNIPIILTGEAGLSIAFNYTYLLDGIQLFGDKVLEFYINDTDSPVIMKSPDIQDVLYLIMPIRD